MRMSELGAKGNELGGIHRQKEALAKWIETTENSVAELLTRHGLHTNQMFKDKIVVFFTQRSF